MSTLAELAHTSSTSSRWTSAATPSSRRAIASGCRSSRSTASVPSCTTSTRPRSCARSTHKVKAVKPADAQSMMRAGTMTTVLQTSTEGAGVSDRLAVGVAARLSRYLQVLTQAKKMGKERISSQEISDYTNINATQIRRDLSAFGKFGKRGVGLRHRQPARGDPQDPPHARSAQHRPDRGRPAGPGDRQLADLRRARDQHRGGVRQ